MFFSGLEALIGNSSSAQKSAGEGEVDPCIERYREYSFYRQTSPMSLGLIQRHFDEVFASF